jgi:hypothetical protein
MVTSSAVVPVAYTALSCEVSIAVPMVKAVCSCGSGRAYSALAASERVTLKVQLPPMAARSMSETVSWPAISGCWLMGWELLPQTMAPVASSLTASAGVKVATTVPWLGSAFTVAFTVMARSVGHASS